MVIYLIFKDPTKYRKLRKFLKKKKVFQKILQNIEK